MSRFCALVALSALVLSGCASMSGDECATSDWRAIGFEDGSRGYTADRLGKHRKACAKHGVTPNFQTYQDGHKEGLTSFCTPSRGFNLGANGGSYNGVCSGHREGDFVDAFNVGHHLHKLRSHVNSADYQISAKQRERDNNQDRMTSREVALISEGLSTGERVQILAELKELSNENGQLEAEIRQLVGDRAIYRERLAEYQAIVADSGY